MNYLLIVVFTFLVAFFSNQEENKQEKVIEKIQEETSTLKEKSYVIQGKSDGKEGDVITLEQVVDNQKKVIQTIKLGKKGKFRFKNGIEKNGFFRVNLNDKASAYLVTDKKKIKVKFNLAEDKVEVLKSPESLLFQEYLKMKSDFMTTAKALTVADMDIKEKRDSLISFQQHYRENMQDFVLKNSPSLVGLHASKEFSKKVNEHKEFFDKIKEVYKEEEYAKAFLIFLKEEMSKTAIN